MSEPFDDELLKPTLTEADDALDFDQPWNPWSLVVLAFFFGLPAGGGLLALNFPRLGMKQRLAPALAVVIGATALMAAVRLWMVAHGMIEIGDREGRAVARHGWKAAACLIAIAIAAPQHRRFRLYQATGRAPGRLLRPALAAIGVSFLVGLIEAVIVITQTSVLDPGGAQP